VSRSAEGRGRALWTGVTGVDLTLPRVARTAPVKRSGLNSGPAFESLHTEAQTAPFDVLSISQRNSGASA
jgi:hypothetical protein